MYADAIDWNIATNTLGMSRHADDGIIAASPTVPVVPISIAWVIFVGLCLLAQKKAIGEDACPITTLYWDFLRHRDRFKTNHRMVMQYKNLDRKDPVELDQILSRAQLIKSGELKV